MTQRVNREQVLQAVEQLAGDPALFASVLLEFSPYEYQKKFLREESKRIVVCAGRQIGKSTMAASRAIWFAVTHRRTTTLIVSATLRQSMNLFQKILDFAERNSLVRNSITRKTHTELCFSNKSRIIALPCGPEGKSIRSYTAHLVIVDEAAFVPDQVISNVIFPMLSTTQGTVIMLSTPWDRAHTFYKAFNSMQWARFHFPTSVNPLVTREFLEEQKELFGEVKFAMEYLAEFRDDERSYYPMSLLRGCVHVCGSLNHCEYCELLSENNLESKLPPETELYAGYDPGGMKDPAALVVVEKCKTNSQGGKPAFRVVKTKTFLSASSKAGESASNPYSRFTVEISDLHKSTHFKKVLVDSTGLGAPIVELCKELGLPTFEMKFTASSKEEILFNLKVLLERKQIVLPADDSTLLASLNCIEAERTRSGGYSFDHPAGSHDDLAYALALAVWTAGKGNAKVIMTREDRESGKSSEVLPSWRQDHGCS